MWAHLLRIGRISYVSGLQLWLRPADDAGMKTQPLPADPVALLERLDPDDIRRRLEEIERERKGLLVLLRASLRARKGQKPRESGKPEVPA